MVNETIKSILKRKSVRFFLNKKVPQEIIDLLIDCAIHAPTGHFDQPWHFTIIQDEDLIKKINLETKEEMSKSKIDWISSRGKNEDFSVFHSAPLIIIVSGKKKSYSPLIDCSAATQNILLAAESLGLGSCWIGLVDFYFKNKDITKLNIPKNYEPYFAISLGYRNLDKKLLVKKRNKKVINYI